MQLVKGLVQITSNQPKSVFRDSLKLNEYMRDLKNASSNMELKAKIKDIRRSDILDAKKGSKSKTKTRTRVSDTIPVSKSLKLSSILFGKRKRMEKFKGN
jgi:hypothetical protein